MSPIGVRVRNDTLTGMGGDGIQLGQSSVVENVRATQNGFVGIEASILRDNFAGLNGRGGMTGRQ